LAANKNTKNIHEKSPYAGTHKVAFRKRKFLSAGTRKDPPENPVRRGGRRVVTKRSIKDKER
jgi:hypothetical protein